MIRSGRPKGEQSNQSQAASYGAAYSIFGVLLSGMLAWGGIGWLVDQWLETELFVPIGLIIGSSGGIYLSYKRFGEGETGQSTISTTDGDDDNATAKPSPPSG